MTRPDVEAKRTRLRETNITDREKAMRRAHDLEERATRCRHMAQQLMDEAYAATIEAVTLRVIWRER